jgi:hypothetical protein
MYYYISLYFALVIGKLFLDYNNDMRLEIYRLDCKGVGPRPKPNLFFEPYLRDEINLCDSDTVYKGTPRSILVPISIIAVIKIILDIGIVLAGAVIFYKLCNYASPDN